jgi:hypothetical protein
VPTKPPTQQAGALHATTPDTSAWDLDLPASDFSNVYTESGALYQHDVTVELIEALQNLRVDEVWHQRVDALLSAGAPRIRAEAPLIHPRSVLDLQENWNAMVEEYCEAVRRVVGAGEWAVAGQQRRLVWLQWDMISYGVADFSALRGAGVPVLLKATQGRGFVWAVGVNELVMQGLATTTRTYVDATRYHTQSVDREFLCHALMLEARCRLGVMSLDREGLPAFGSHNGALQELLAANCVQKKVNNVTTLFCTQREWGEMLCALLLGRHARCGEHSLLRGLVDDTFRQIVEMC